MARKGRRHKAKALSALRLFPLYGPLRALELREVSI